MQQQQQEEEAVSPNHLGVNCMNPSFLHCSIKGQKTR